LRSDDNPQAAAATHDFDQHRRRFGSSDNPPDLFETARFGSIDPDKTIARFDSRRRGTAARHHGVDAVRP
jgi:hypothetical protein